MSLGLFENLLEPSFKQLHVPGIGDRIENGLVLPTRLEQPKGFKLRKLLLDSRPAFEPAQIRCFYSPSWA